ncbi:MAG: O-antigen ligase family protein [Actinomycetaceae bacterium]|nr:O-antigen ligase family protein [Actinomycetaceae bacterium]
MRSNDEQSAPTATGGLGTKRRPLSSPNSARSTEETSAPGQVKALPPSTHWMAFIVFLLPFSAIMGRWMSVSPGAASYPYAHRVLVLGLGIWVAIDLISTKRQPLYLWLAVVFMLTSFTWGILSVQWSADPELGLQKTVGLVIQTVALAGLLKLIHRRPADLMWLRYGIVAGAITVIGISVWEIRTSRHLSDLVGQPWLFSYRDFPIATFVNPNNLAVFLTFATAVSFSLMLSSKRIIPKAVFLTVIAGSGYMIVQAQSVGMLATFAMVVGVYLLWMLRRQAGTVILVVLLGLTAVFSAAALGKFSLESLFHRVVDENQMASFDSRWITYRFGLKLFFDSYGLGIGPGSFESYVNDVVWKVSKDQVPLVNPHNTILELLVSYGILVAVPIIILMVWAFVTIMRVLFTSKDEHTQLQALEAVTSTLVLLAGSLVASSLMIESTWWLNVAYVIAIATVVAGPQTMMTGSEWEPTSLED